MMTIQFPSDLQDYLRTTVAKGEYASEQDLVINAVEILRELKSRHEQLRRDIQLGIDQCNRGETQDLDIGKIKAEGRRALATGRGGASE